MCFPETEYVFWTQNVSSGHRMCLREAECAITFEPFSRVGLEDAVVKNGSMVLIHSATEQVWLCKGGRHPKLHLLRALLLFRGFGLRLRFLLLLVYFLLV